MQARLEYRPELFGYKVWFIQKYDGDVIWFYDPVTRKVEKLVDGKEPPYLFLQETAFQALLTEAVQMRCPVPTVGELKRVEAHLEDMRKLVFK